MTNIPRRRPAFGEDVILNETDPRDPSARADSGNAPPVVPFRERAAKLKSAVVAAASRSSAGIRLRAGAIPTAPLIIACTALFILTAGASTLFGARSSDASLEAVIASQEQLRGEIRRLETELEALKGTVPGTIPGSVPAAETAAAAAAAPDSRADDTTPIRVASYAPTEHERDDPFFGSKEAPVLMEVFSDFQCTLCRKYHRDVILALREKYPEDELRVVFRDFPLQSNARAKEAAAFAHCAGEQSAYWEAFELLTDSGAVYQTGDFRGLGQSLTTVNQAKLAQCLASNRYSNETDGDVADALQLGAKGAPSAFIGLRRGSRYDGVFVRGAQPLAVIEQEIAGMLERSRP